ncbi:type II toxin-antitoxin system RelB/DinJ family antitoxin [Patescibacteria group bacterium]|nr:type II toxin-antitoxin system RelB/DinJ family antitoxin [Patescibacteria group bacterium]
MSTIQIRIKDSTKKSAKKVLDKIGLDMSSAVKLYIHQIILHQGIPFRLVTENGLTPTEEEEILQAEHDAEQGKNVTKAMSQKEALAYLRKL